MSWPKNSVPEMCEEVHFGGRRMRYFAERPGSLDQMLREAVVSNSGGEAVVAGDERLTYAELGATVNRAALVLSVWAAYLPVQCTPASPSAYNSPPATGHMHVKGTRP